VRTSTNASTRATGRSARKDAGKDGVALLPGMMVGSTAALVAFGLALTVFAGPLFQLCDAAAKDMLNRSAYIESVLGETAPHQGVLPQ
jgi:multicomponent Na+:H+ antiporter subunit D